MGLGVEKLNIKKRKKGGECVTVDPAKFLVFIV